jgi:hypothetical protein
MWWKFWTWFRHDDAHQHAGNPPANRLGTRAVAGGAEPKKSEDILTSISSLIDQQLDGEQGERQTTRTYDAIRLDDQTTKAGPDEANHDTWSGDRQSDTGTSDTVEVAGPIAAVDDCRPNSDSVAPPPSVQRREPPPNRPSEGPNRYESQKTLVAEEGHWPSFKGLAESFKDLDDADNDSDGTSPFETIVPHDQ